MDLESGKGQLLAYIKKFQYFLIILGIGHVENSSFPVGGESTRAVLTGHRGLPNAKLFTRIDEMEYGDLFYINVLDDVKPVVLSCLGHFLPLSV